MTKILLVAQTFLGVLSTEPSKHSDFINNILKCFFLFLTELLLCFTEEVAKFKLIVYPEIFCWKYRTAYNGIEFSQH